MSYQAVIRNASNNLVTNAVVAMKISILQGSSSGSVVYAETQTPTTNANGLVSLVIGEGSVVSGSLSAIDWSAGAYFLQTETDPTGGTDYSITGTSRLMSVPYAFYDTSATNFTGAFSGDVSGTQRATVIGTGKVTNAMLAGSKYSATQNGIKYGDWYLPSLWELNLIYTNKATIDATALGNGGSALSSGNYWSSTEESINSAFFKNLSTGSQAGNNLKFSYFYVRAIRAF